MLLGRRSVMDITKDSGSLDGGSIPSGDIRNGILRIYIKQAL